MILREFTGLHSASNEKMWGRQKKIGKRLLLVSVTHEIGNELSDENLG